MRIEQTLPEDVAVHRFGPRTTRALGGIVLALLVAGCARSTLEGSVADTHGGRDPTTELDFWDGIARVPAVSNHDALHALMLYFGGPPAGAGGAAGGEADGGSFAALLAAARERGWVDADEDLPRNETARVGWIARAVCLEAGVEGGVVMRVVGPRERYAVRELNYMGWLPEMSRHQALSGAHLIALLGRADDYRQRKGDL